MSVWDSFDIFSFEVLAPGEEEGENISIVSAPGPAPPVPQLPSISDLPTPSLPPDHLQAQSLPHNTVPRSEHGKGTRRR